VCDKNNSDNIICDNIICDNIIYDNIICDNIICDNIIRENIICDKYCEAVLGWSLCYVECCVPVLFVKHWTMFKHLYFRLVPPGATIPKCVTCGTSQEWGTWEHVSSAPVSTLGQEGLG